MKSPVMRRCHFKLKSKIAKINFFKVISIAVIIIMFFAFIDVYNNSFKPQLQSLSQSRASFLLNNALNEGINEVVLKNTVMYDDLVSLITDNEGKISGLMTNLVTANRLKSEFSLNINKKINNLDNVKIAIPLGNLTKLNTLSGLGPKIKITLIPSGRVSIDFKNAFSEAGINQTKHEIFLEVKTTASLLMPSGLYSKSDITSKIPLCESIIVGNVPDSLTRLETRDETLRDDILNIY